MGVRTIERVIAARTERIHHRTGPARRTVTDWLVLMLMLTLALAIVAPLGLMLLNAFKSQADYSSSGPLSFPNPMQLDNLLLYVERTDFFRKLANSIIVSGSVSLLTVAISAMAAYPLSIGRIRGRGIVLAALMIAFIVPQEALIYPIFTGAQLLHVADTLFSVIVVLSVLNAAFGTYFLASVMGTIPREIVESAQTDGAGRLRTLWSIVLPLMRPSLGVLFVLVFVWSWNDFFIPLVLLTSSEVQTVPIALASLQGDRFLDPTMVAAGSLISLIPTMVFFLVFQRTLVQGVSVGAIR